MWIDAAAVRELLDMAALIDALATADRSRFAAPDRLHYEVAHGDLLAMPAASPSFLGMKIVTVYPGNSGTAIPTVQATYQLFSAQTGELLATIDGTELTLWRTAAVAAVAALHLYRRAPEHILIVGTGALSPYLVSAFAASYPRSEIAIWGRRPGAGELVARASPRGVAAMPDLEAATRRADIICCATSSAAPLVLGSWLKKDAHLGLIGGYTPQMHETDSLAFREAFVVVDTPAAMTSAGELLAAIRDGYLREDEPLTLKSLLSREVGLRANASRTLFKSIGSAENDLIAAEYLWRCLSPYRN
ncbi:MAG: hypothetical protein JHC57_08685 [Sphingopyxis sp.]|uniref:hypothetical protein n=1 Tax=Sphingopyxis sp. TaxID=1908224 RepID=UPI001A18C42F|nr:hypothetical protein [Sphingopyxis sp.]MBJ7499814.1 hypothetical protein [Sphingopyxis sp.]